MPSAPIALDAAAFAACVVAREPALELPPPIREVEDRMPADIPDVGPLDEALELEETTAGLALVLPVVGELGVLLLLPLPPPEPPPPELRPPRSLELKLDPSPRPA